MPRLEKGSQAAKDWAKKMREAKMSKMKGGYLQPGEVPPASGPPEELEDKLLATTCVNNGKPSIDEVEGEGMNCKCPTCNGTGIKKVVKKVVKKSSKPKKLVIEE